MRISQSGFLLPPILGLVTVLALSSCGDSTEPGVQPTILLINPRGLPTGSSGYAVQIYGENIGGDATVRWNGEARTANPGGQNLVYGLVTAADLALPGTAQVTVSSNGRTSTPATFVIGEYLEPALTLTSVIPAKGTTEIGPIEITATGSGFIPGTRLYLYGSELETTLVSSTTLRAIVPNIQNPFTPDLRVGIPEIWRSSAFLPWEVEAAAPVLSSLSPATAGSGGSDLLVRVLGSGFISTSEVRVNGALRGTSWVSATELKVYLSGPVDLAEAGTLAITVVTPHPGGGTSSAVDFIVTN
jgi:hypothetical protein